MLGSLALVASLTINGGVMANLQDVAQCFLYLDAQQEGDGISNLKLQKLAYYAQGFFCALYNKPLFDNKIFALSFLN